MFRDQNDITYTVPQIDPVYVSALSYEYYNPSAPVSPAYQAELTPTDFGTFSGSFTIPADAALGAFSIKAGGCVYGKWDCDSPYSASINFEVAEFRVPEFEVEVTPQSSEVISGDPVNALVKADYYFGGAVGQAAVTWAFYRDYNRSAFQYKGESGFRFYDEDYQRGSGADSTAPRQTDMAGQYLIQAPVTLNSSYPMRFIVEGTVTDESGQAISARSSVLVHPADVYVGLRQTQTFGSADQDYDVDVLTVAPDSNLRPQQAVQLEVTEIRWVRKTLEFGRYNWESQEIPVDNVTLTTGADGKASYRFTPPNAGNFRIRAVTYDAQGRKASSAIRIYAQETAHSTQRVWWDAYKENLICGFTDEFQQLRVIADQTSYRPGDTAEIFIPNPYDEPVEALITMERAGVMHQETIRITGDALTYRVTLTDADAPNVYINVLLVRGVSADNPDPAYIRGDVRLDVEPVARRLNIELTASTLTTKPGDTVTFHVHLTDSNGQPVQGEVGMALTDEAALALRPPNAGTLEATFYGQQSLRVNTAVAQRSLLTVPGNTMEAGCGGGGGGMPPGDGNIREDYVYTPLWANVVTDANGDGQVSVAMPDNLTRWRLDA
ncbi:MAG: hypothetical protein ABI700_08935 [Chloroflexota bacterium]